MKPIIIFLKLRYLMTEVYLLITGGYRIRLEKEQLKDVELFKETLKSCGCKLKNTQVQELISTINKYW